MHQETKIGSRGPAYKPVASDPALEAKDEVRLLVHGLMKRLREALEMEPERIGGLTVGDIAGQDAVSSPPSEQYASMRHLYPYGPCSRRMITRITQN